MLLKNMIMMNFITIQLTFQYNVGIQQTLIEKIIVIIGPT